MSRQPHCRSPSVWRLLLLAFAMLGLVAQPVIACIGTLHEEEHAATQSAGSQHGDHAHEVDASSDGDRDSAPTGVLHLLMHHAPCCGQSAAASSTVVQVPTLAGPTMRFSFETPHVPPAASLAPFRPPILT